MFNTETIILNSLEALSRFGNRQDFVENYIDVATEPIYEGRDIIKKTMEYRRYY